MGSLFKGCVLAAAAILAAWPGTAEAQYSGNELKAHCSAEQATYMSGICDGYVSGIYDGHLAAAAFREFPRAICRPDAVTNGQMVAVVRKYLDEKPHRLHLDAASLVFSALFIAFPCTDD